MEQGRLRRASRVISTGPGAGLVTRDTWRYARDRPRPRARPPRGAAQRSGPPVGGQSRPLPPSLLRALFPSFPPPHGLHPPPTLSSHCWHTLPKALAARVSPPWPGGQAALLGAAGAGTHATVRMTAAVQPESCSWACGEHATLGGRSTESRTPVCFMPTFARCWSFCRP